jgi:hypothetical protein
MTEATVRAALVKKLRQYKDWIVLRHEDHYTSGIPDISVTGNKITSWWETKYQKGFSLVNKGIQQYTLEQLAKHGYAYYLIYTPEQVAIVEPSLSDSKIFPGINHSEVVKYIRMKHGLEVL